ncbi:type VI secretion system lipoprotein TssJ, partial [Acinetobacter baumannii]
QVKTLRLDFSARNALNTDNREDNSASQPVMVRVYVLKDRKTFEKTVYQQLAAEGEDILKDDQLASRSLVLKPGTAMSLTMPLD